MGNKCTIAKTKLKEFSKFVEYLGYDIDDCEKHAHQVMRFKIPKCPMGILFDGKPPVHYTANEAAMPFVLKYLRSKKL